MFCPKCATQNLEGARFCRACGADISLVPQALSGQLAAQQQPTEVDEDDDYYGRRRRRKRGKKPSLEEGIKSLFMGIGFIMVAFAAREYAPGGSVWWFWMFIPAVAMIGGGIGQIVRVKSGQNNNARLPTMTPPTPQAFASTPRAAELPPRNTSELVPPPPSVTEGTTRHLGAEAPTRHIGTPIERLKEE